jgi:hypothetical protein
MYKKGSFLASHRRAFWAAVADGEPTPRRGVSAGVVRYAGDDFPSARQPRGKNAAARRAARALRLGRALKAAGK